MVLLAKKLFAEVNHFVTHELQIWAFSGFKKMITRAKNSIPAIDQGTMRLGICLPQPSARYFFVTGYAITAKLDFTMFDVQAVEVLHADFLVADHAPELPRPHLVK